MKQHEFLGHQSPPKMSFSKDLATTSPIKLEKLNNLNKSNRSLTHIKRRSNLQTNINNLQTVTFDEDRK